MRNSAVQYRNSSAILSKSRYATQSMRKCATLFKNRSAIQFKNSSARLLQIPSMNSSVLQCRISSA